MPIVAGVDFGTLSVRVTLLDSDTGSSGKVRGRLGTRKSFKKAIVTLEKGDSLDIL